MSYLVNLVYLKNVILVGLNCSGCSCFELSCCIVWFAVVCVTLILCGAAPRVKMCDLQLPALQYAHRFYCMIVITYPCTAAHSEQILPCTYNGTIAQHPVVQCIVAVYIADH